MLFRRKYDVFISYAIEDKNEVAGIIASFLKGKGIRVWFVGSELKVGAQVSSVISDGLRNSSYCIIIISPDYTRHWTAVEFYRFIELEQTKRKTLLLPVWHNINYNEVKKNHPMIADRYALSTSKGMTSVCHELYNELSRRKKINRRSGIKKIAGTAFLLILSALLFSMAFRNHFFTHHTIPDNQSLVSAVEHRIADLQSQAENELRQKIATDSGRMTTLDSIFVLYNSYLNTSDYDRNEFRFSNGFSAVTGLKNIKTAGISIMAAPYTSYGISSPSCYLFGKNLHTAPDSIFRCSFALLNTDSVSYSIDSAFFDEDELHLLVSYTGNIRTVDITLSYPFKPGRIRKEQVNIKGYKPTEEYILEPKNNSWRISGIR